jgi:hypothetical protein
MSGYMIRLWSGHFCMNANPGIYIIILLLMFSGKTAAQDKERIYSVPLKYFSFWVLNDPKCPVQLEEPKIYADGDGEMHYSYTFVNTINKPITRLVIEEFEAFENPRYGATPNIDPKEQAPLMPGEKISLLYEPRFEIVKLDEAKAANFKLSQDHRRIRIVVVTTVETIDGDKFDAVSKSSRIQKFIDETEESSYDYSNDKVLKTFKQKTELLMKFLTKEIQMNSDFLKEQE